jgi:DNA invertase Pin-like site-specific DNA recombinase
MIDLTAVDCVAYVRVSTEEQAGEKQTSLADQLAACQALAAKLGRTIGHVFRDAGISGATMQQRPGMRSLIDACAYSPRSGKRPALVLALNDSRWGRFPDPEESAYWRVHLSKCGWRVRFAEHDDVQDDETRPIMRAIGATQASLFRKTLKANVKRGTKGTAQQGFWQARAPFGYARKVVFPLGRERILAPGVPKAPDEKIVLVPHPEEAPIVREMFARYASGVESIHSLTEWAVRRLPSRRWTVAAVRFMLRSPTYVGDVVWGKKPSEPDADGVRRYRPDAEWYGKDNAHEPLVSRSMFAAVQDRLEHNRRHTRAARSDFLVSGIVRCRCGCGFTGNASTRRTKAGRVPVANYHCTTLTSHRASHCAYPGSVSKRYLEDAVLGTLADEIGSALHRRMIGPALDRMARQAKRAARTVELIDRDIADTKAKQGRLVAAIEADTISTIEAHERMTELRRTITTLVAERERIAKVETGDGLPEQQRDTLIALAMDFRATATALKGPALRELIRPWIKHAEFNTTTRELTMEIRRVPAMRGGLPMRDLSEMEQGAAQKANRELTVTRRVKVGGSR